MKFYFVTYNQMLLGRFKEHRRDFSWMEHVNFWSTCLGEYFDWRE